MLERAPAIRRMNELGALGIPFFFFTDFLGTKCWIQPTSEIDPQELSFDINHQPNTEHSTIPFSFEKHPLTAAEFHGPYQHVIDQIHYGNSYLVNLTFKTPITTNLSLGEIFSASKAKYKMRYSDQFVVFSPETFVKIKDGIISSYPMKGTINAAIHDAAEKILHDPKETAEHVTIVDLIRNDLSQVANQVKVSRFRYLTALTTHDKTLLQVSSEISGELPVDYQEHLGSILFRLLPAGSISGAPKRETIHIIQQAEKNNRGFYTGVCGHFDGKDLDSGVMIRFIERTDNQLYYRSGGGITAFSEEAKEYQEMVDKVYLPFDTQNPK